MIRTSFISPPSRRFVRQPLPTIDFPGIKARVDLLALIERDLGPSNRGKFRCPFHDDHNPSLSVRDGTWRCWSGACGAKGDAFDWVMRRHGASNKAEAAKILDPSVVTAADVRADRRGEARPTRPVMAPPPVRQVATDETRAGRPRWHDLAWQAAMTLLIDDASDRLWSPVGRPALDYLHRRGLDDHTIRHFRLGFFARDWTCSARLDVLAEGDGQPRAISVPRGITIPWAAPGAWYARHDPDGAEPDGPRWCGMNVRVIGKEPDGPRPSWDGKGEAPKYLAVRGSERGHFYPWPDLLPTQGSVPLLLVEGEFDALLAHQEIGHLLHVATAGSASTTEIKEEARRFIAACPKLLVGLDSYEDAGSRAAAEWMDRYPRLAIRATVTRGKDLSDYWREVGNLTGWANRLLAKVERRMAAAPVSATPSRLHA